MSNQFKVKNGIIVSGSANIENNLIVTGSSKLGSTLNDTHQITGSLSISGSINISGTTSINSVNNTPGDILTLVGDVVSKRTRTEILSDIGGVSTGSFNTYTGSLNTFTSSIRSDFNSYTSSNDTTNIIQNNRITSIETATGSLNNFTSSINITIKDRLNADLIVSGSGTTNNIVKWTTPNSIGNSILYETGSFLGINTSTPESTLDIRSNTSTANTLIIRNDDPTGGTKLSFRYGIFETGYIHNFFDGGYFSSVINSSGYLGFNVGGNNRMRIDVAGNVGIGLGTTNATTRLHVDNITSYNSATPNGAIITSNLVSNNAIIDIGVDSTYLGYIQSRNILNTTPYNLNLNPIGGNVLIGDVVDSGHKLQVNGTVRNLNNLIYSGGSLFLRNPSNTFDWALYHTNTNHLYFDFNGSNRLSIDSSGNVGIGTTNPTSKLTILNSGQLIKFATGTNTSGYELGVGVNDDGINFTNDSSVRGYNFKNTNGTLFTINSSGDVGIGTNNPNYTLHLNRGNSETGILTSYNSNQIYLSHGGWGMGAGKFGIGNGGAPAIVFDTNTNRIGIGTTTPSQILHLKTGNPIIQFEKTGVLNWHLGNLFENDFYIGNDFSANRFRMTFGGNIILGSDSGDSGERLQVNGTSKFSSDITLNANLNISGIGKYTSLTSTNIDTVLTSLSSYNGNVINVNPHFREGTVGYIVYNNSLNGSVTFTTLQDTNSPSASTNILRISYNGTSASPGYGGFCTAFSQRGTLLDRGYIQGNRYVYRIIAKIPVGRYIEFQSNAFGNNGSGTWLTDQNGSGTWKEYIFYQKIGFGGTLSSTSFFNINGGSNVAFTWDVAMFAFIALDEPNSTDYLRKLNIGNTISAPEGGLALTNYLTTSSDILVGTSFPLLPNPGRGNITINGASDAILTLGVGGSWYSYLYSNLGGTYLSSRNGFIDLETGGVGNRLRVGANGNILINTTTDSGERLNVNGNSRIGNIKIQGIDGLRIGFNRNTENGQIYNTSLPAHQIQSTSNGLEFQSYTSSGVQNGGLFFKDGKLILNTSGIDSGELLQVGGTARVNGQILMTSSTAATGVFGTVSSSWGGSTSYPTLYSTSPDRWIMHINPHISYTQPGVNGYSGSMVGATIRMAGDVNVGSYWDLGIGTNGVGQDKFSIGRNASPFLNITNSGNVGVGTTSPTSKLHVVVTPVSGALALSYDELILESNTTNSGMTIKGPDTAQNGIRWNSPSSTQFGYAYISSIYNGLLSIATNASGGEISFNTSSNLERMRIFVDGNVGINTTTNTGERLQVNGNVKIGGYIEALSNNGVKARLGTTTASWSGNSVYPTLFSNNDSMWVMHINPHISYVSPGVNGYNGTMIGATIRMADNTTVNNSWDLGIGTNGVGQDKFSIGRNASPFLNITNSGNVGVGTTTPQKRFEAISNVNDFLSVGVSSFHVGQYSGIHFGYAESTNTLYRKSAIVFERTDLTTGNAQGKIHILNGSQSTAASATLVDAKLTINEYGQIGIGTRNPSKLLDIVGDHNTTTFRLLYDGRDSGGGLSSSLDFWASEPGVTYDGAGLGHNVNGHPFYGRRDTTRGQSYIRFVNGITYFYNNTGDALTSVRWAINTNGNLITDGSSDSGEKLQVNGTIKCTTLTETSSQRYKDNILTIENSLDKITKLRGVTYTRKETNNTEYGLIAEEVYDVLPELVNKNLNGEIESISYGRITSLLIESIKEQQKQIEEQQQQINKLIELLNGNS